MSFFSIITVTRNNRTGLQSTAKSLQHQDCRDFEWIIIDGGSTDGTRDDLAALPAQSVSEPDHGIYDAMNKGIERATGDYLLFLNAGDQLAGPDVLARLRHDLKGEDFVYGDSLEAGQQKVARPHQRIVMGMHTHHQAMLYRRAALGDLRYDLTYPIAADYKLTALFLIRSKTVRYWPYPLCVFEQGGVSQTHARQGRIEQFSVREEIRACSPTHNVLIYLAQSCMMALRQVFPGLYWKIKQVRA